VKRRHVFGERTRNDHAIAYISELVTKVRFAKILAVMRQAFLV